MIDLTIHFDGSGEKHLYEQIYEHIKKEIREGKLLQEERLPSTRSLAENLQISRSTASAAYEQLVAEGYLEARPNKGYYVSRYEDLYHLGVKKGKQQESQESLPKKNAYKIEFALNGMGEDLFPHATWRSLYKETMKKHSGDLFRLGDPQGEIELRTTISRYLHSSRGVNCSPSQILIGAGNDYLLLVLDKILGERASIAMEEITYNRAFQVFKSCGHQIIRVGMDTNGIRIDDLEKSEASLAYVMPAHQFPMGIVMPMSRRMELLGWAHEKEERYIIEDDYDSEFRYQGKPIPALCASDVKDKVIYIGTFSKSIAPAIRISYLVLPESLLGKYRERALFLASTVSRTDQFMLNEFIREGYFERHLNKMRKGYKNKHDLLLEELRAFGHAFTISGENAGLHLLLHSKQNKTDSKLQQEALQSGVKVTTLSELLLPGEVSQSKHKGTILLGYGGLTEIEILEGMKALKNAWAE